MSPSLTGDPMAGPVEEEKGRRGIYMYMWQVGKPNNYDKINTELKQYVQNHQSI